MVWAGIRFLNAGSPKQDIIAYTSNAGETVITFFAWSHAKITGATGGLNVKIHIADKVRAFTAKIISIYMIFRVALFARTVV